jgi:hypothetical protein
MKFKPDTTMLYEAEIVLQSDRWLTDSGGLRRMDGDNREKQLWDAIEVATGLPDENIITVHRTKALGPEETRVRLLPLGRVTE